MSDDQTSAEDTRIPVLPEPDHILDARRKWQYNGTTRPDFAEPTGDGQVSVWDFPRPPVILPCTQKLTVSYDGTVLAETRRGVRVLETAGAPTYYFPPEDVSTTLSYGDLSSVCEWKGVAQDCTHPSLGPIGWRYVRMFPAFLDLYQWVSFYPGRVACFVDAEQARPQPGGFYGGWVTDDLTGPIKGVQDSTSW